MPTHGIRVVRFMLRVLLVTVASALGGYGTALTSSEVCAEGAPVPITIELPATLQIPPNREVPIPVRISPDTALPKQSIVLIRGLPSSIALSVGRAFDSGIWGIKPSELPDLRINSLGGAGTTSRLSISVVTLDGTVLAEALANLVVVTPAEVAATPKTSTGVQTRPGIGNTASASADTMPKPPATAEDKARIASLMQKGDEYLKFGNVLVARSFYARASDLGSDAAMLALARTFDPGELSRAALPITVKPDVELAKKWYEKAKQFGSADATKYLARLPQ